MIITSLPLLLLLLLIITIATNITILRGHGSRRDDGATVAVVVLARREKGQRGMSWGSFGFPSFRKSKEPQLIPLYPFFRGGRGTTDRHRNTGAAQRDPTPRNPIYFMSLKCSG